MINQRFSNGYREQVVARRHWGNQLYIRPKVFFNNTLQQVKK